MQSEFINHPYNVYSAYLKTIRGKEFTSRELDVIACIVCGRSATVSTFLSISPKTVSAHITNILQKISGNSREDIINFVEKSDQYSLVKKYYQNLVIYFSFESYLVRKLSSLRAVSAINNTAHTRSQLRESMVFIRDLEKHLNLLDIKVCHLRKESCANPVEYIQLNQDKCFILIVSDNEIEHLKLKLNSKILILQNLIQGSLHEHFNENLVIVYGNSPAKLDNVHVINFKEYSNYYLAVFSVLKTLSPLVDSEQLSKEFMQLIQTLEDPSELSNADNSSKDNSVFLWTNRLKKNFLRIFSFVSFLLGCIYCFVVFFHQESRIIIRSDLPIPNEASFLKRPKTISQITKKLAENSKISTISIIAITGIGGAGKTTLARYYAKSSRASIVWELNAETRESLINSFKELAYAFAKTKNQKEELLFIQQTISPEEKEKQLLFFVKSQLKEHPNWLLIYDNVRSLSVIKRFLPLDSQSWGKGTAIVTTQDSNIKNTTYMSSENIIAVEELTPEEMLTLFSKITFDLPPSQLTDEQKNKAISFLTHIPPFPLDVSLATYYLKNSQIAYEKYLEIIDSDKKIFDKVEENLIEEVSDYNKTRLNIVRSSFLKVIEKDPEFKDLLFLVCFLDSQDISKIFLDFYKSPIITQSLIHELKKYSIVTNYSPSGNEEVMFSMHRSTQNLGRECLLDLLNQTDQKELFDKMVAMIHSFYQTNIEKNHSVIRAHIPHFQAFLENIQTVNMPIKLKNEYKKNISFILGYIHKRCFRNLTLEKKYFCDVYDLEKETHLFSDKRFAILLKDLASTCVDLELTDEAILYVEKGIKILKNLSECGVLLSENYRLLGIIYTHKNDFKQAESYFKEALKMLATIDFDGAKELESNIYSDLAWLYSVTYINGNRAEAAKSYINKSLKVIDGDSFFYNQTKLPQKILSRYIALHKTTLGDIYCRFGDYKQAATEGFREVEYIINNNLDNCFHYLSKIYVSIGMGEIYLREGNLKEAKAKITKTIEEIEKIAGSNTSLALSSRIFLMETKIRLGELKEAYADYLSFLGIEKRTDTNYSNLMYFLCHYHAAIAQYKLGNSQKSIEHFSDFLDRMKLFCSRFFDEEIYQSLVLDKVFEMPPHQVSIEAVLRQYLRKSAEILTKIYGFRHPFIIDFVLKNEI